MSAYADIENMPVSGWQWYVEMLKCEFGDADAAPLAVRCENSMLTVGWRAGGFTMCGHTYFSFRSPTGNGEIAMIAIRDDFRNRVLREVKKRRNEESKSVLKYNQDEFL